MLAGVDIGRLNQLADELEPDTFTKLSQELETKRREQQKK